MGRRSINTTKSGKYMNPTDQARKEARKRELKKNKKQRMAVRAAVLKNKDPLGLLQDLEALDELELNPEVNTDLNEKVIRDKRKKIKETFERVLKLYNREDSDRYSEFKKAEKQYDKRRAEKVKTYEAIRDARQVSVDSIPLPEAPNALSAIPLPEDIPLPGSQPPSILKKGSAYGPPLIPPPFMAHIQPMLPTLTWPYCLPNGKKPPGPPPGLPPGVSMPPPGPPAGLPPHLLAAHHMEQRLRAEGLENSSDEEDEEMEELREEREEDSDEMETDDSDSENEQDNERRRTDRRDDSDEDSMADEQEKDARERKEEDGDRVERRRRRGSDDEDDDYQKRRSRRRSSSSDDDDSYRDRREKRSVRFADDDDDSADSKLSRKLPPGMTPLQARMLAMAGQQIPVTTAMEEEEEEEEEEQETEQRRPKPEDDDEEEEEEEERDTEEQMVDAQLEALRQASTAKSSAAPLLPLTGVSGGAPPVALVPQAGPRGPPAGPPPGPPPTAPPGFPGIPLPAGVPPNFARPPPLRPPPPPLRMMLSGPRGSRPPAPPPGPPPGVPPLLRGGLPPRLPLPPGMLPPPRLPMAHLRPGMPRLENPNVFSAAPVIRRLPTKAEETAEIKSAATIEAKPQIRNLAADVTRFMPTSLRVKRDAKGKTKGLKSGGAEETSVAPAMKPNPAVQGATKDDAYDQFMKEMGELM